VLTLSNLDTAWLAEKEDRVKRSALPARPRWLGAEGRSGRKRCCWSWAATRRSLSRRLAGPGRAAARTARAAFNYAGHPASACSGFLWSGAFSRPTCGKSSRRRPSWFRRPADEATEVADDPAGRGGAGGGLDQGAVENGAKLVAGGERRGSAVTRILTATKAGMKVRDEEAFGPVLCIEPTRTSSRRWPT